MRFLDFMCISLKVYTILYGAEFPQDIELLKNFELCSIFKVGLKKCTWID